MSEQTGWASATCGMSLLAPATAVSPELALVDKELADAERRRMTGSSVPCAAATVPVGHGAVERATVVRLGLLPVARRRRREWARKLGGVAAGGIFGISLVVNGYLTSIVVVGHRTPSATVVVTTTETIDTRLADAGPPLPFEGPTLPGVTSVGHAGLRSGPRRPVSAARVSRLPARARAQP